jgi:hypothetical protein
MSFDNHPPVGLEGASSQSSVIHLLVFVDDEQLYQELQWSNSKN